MVTGRLGSIDSENSDEKLSASATFEWNLLPVGETTSCGRIIPGLYSLQNKLSETFVMMGPNGTLGCWPEADFRDCNTKLVSSTWARNGQKRWNRTY